MICTFRTILEFCYIAQKDALTEVNLGQLEDSLSRFHRNRMIFVSSGVHLDGISLPHQHSLVHYPSHIRNFAAPNGLCLSMTESKHIRAVKEPWCCSSRNKPLGQMLVTNQCLDQLSAAQTDFRSCAMLGKTQTNELQSMFIFPLYSFLGPNLSCAAYSYRDRKPWMR